MDPMIKNSFFTILIYWNDNRIHLGLTKKLIFFILFPPLFKKRPRVSSTQVWVSNRFLGLVWPEYDLWGSTIFLARMDGSREEQAVIADLKSVVKTLSEALSQVETTLKVKKYYIEHLQKNCKKKKKERLSRDCVEANFYKLLPICPLFCSTAFSPSSRY